MCRARTLHARAICSGLGPKSYYLQNLPAKRFQLIYPDHSRAHINLEERDALLASLRIRKIDEHRYAYVALAQISRSFSNLGELRERFQPLKPIKRYLEGQFTIQLGEKRFTERLETAEGLAIRIQLRGATA